MSDSGQPAEVRRCIVLTVFCYLRWNICINDFSPFEISSPPAVAKRFQLSFTQSRMSDAAAVRELGACALRFRQSSPSIFAAMPTETFRGRQSTEPGGSPIRHVSTSGTCRRPASAPPNRSTAPQREIEPREVSPFAAHASAPRPNPPRAFPF